MTNVKWLELDLDRTPEQDAIEFAFKKTIVSVSARVDFTKSDGALHSEAKIKLNLFFKGDIKVDGVSHGPTVGPVGFTEYREQQDDKAARTWIAKGDELTCIRDGHPDGRTYSTVGAAPILNVLSLLSIFSTWRPHEAPEFAAQFVVIDKIFALRFVVTGDDFSIYVREVKAPLTDAAWRILPWPANSMVEGSWDNDTSSINHLRVRVPILGLIEIPLNRAAKRA